MQFEQRLDLLERLRAYMLSDDPRWLSVKESAFMHNGWFIPDFIDLAVQNIANELLEKSRLQHLWTEHSISAIDPASRTVGVIMPGNIPLGGFDYVICIFLAGFRQRIHLSRKDEVLIKHIREVLISWDSTVNEYLVFEEMLKGCDAYVGLVEHNTSMRFEQYFNKYPAFIYRMQKSAAILYGNESRADLELLADDVFRYFGQGRLSVSKLYVPRQYDFIPLLKAFDSYLYLADHNKYKNNYDYQLSLLILNKEFYMTNGCLLLTENKSCFSPIARLNFEYSEDSGSVLGVRSSEGNDHSLVGAGNRPFGRSADSASFAAEPSTGFLQFLRDL